MLPVMEHSGSLRWNLLAVEMFEMTTKELEHYRSLANKAVSGFERGLTPILKEVLVGVKCYHTASRATEKSFMKGSQSLWKTSLLSYF